MEKESELDNKESSRGCFAASVLLKSTEWDLEKIIDDLKKDWDIEASDRDNDKDALVFSVGKMNVVLGLMKGKVPDNEAEINAENNYRWKEAVQVTKTHKAHILVAILGKEQSLIEIGKLFVKTCASCLKQKNAIGIYTAGTVFEPNFYIDASLIMKDGDLPILNWIYLGLYMGEKGLCAYTYGMDVFGKDNIELLDTDEEPENLYGFLLDIVYYVLDSDITLKDGETIGFSEEQKLKITKSKGVSIEGETLKIDYIK